MANSSLPRADADRVSVDTITRDQSQPKFTTETMVERLSRARTVNEMSIIVGLKPIRGRSAPKIAY